MTILESKLSHLQSEGSYCLLDFYGFETAKCDIPKFFIINSSLLIFVSVDIHFGDSLERSKNQKIEVQDRQNNSKSLAFSDVNLLHLF